MPLTVIEDREDLTDAAAQRRVLDSLPLKRFEDAVAETPMKVLASTKIDILQINVGKKCNQTCAHCHVDAGPDREEVMPDDVVDEVLKVLETGDVDLFDITGGAPELHPRFDEMVERAAAAGVRVMDRCNLTILMTRKYGQHHELFARHGVEVVASLPYHSERNTDRQRGDGVYEKSIAALKKLNSVGYGTELPLTLVTNPVGAFLPAPQAGLEEDFRRQLRRKHGVEFTSLIAITNMPISRYLEWLRRSGNFDGYMEKLVNAFNPAAAEGVMCRNTISVGYDGALYDCDFNQMLEMPVLPDYPQTIFEWNKARLDEREIAVAAHCYGCTAGQGSSCGGATA
jgi:radical SAM/Cys-rich protein